MDLFSAAICLVRLLTDETWLAMEASRDWVMEFRLSSMDASISVSDRAVSMASVRTAALDDVAERFSRLAMKSSRTAEMPESLELLNSDSTWARLVAMVS